LEANPGQLHYIIGAIGDLPSEHGADSLAVGIIRQRLVETKDHQLATTMRRLLASLSFRARRWSEALEQYRQLDRQGERGHELLEFARLLGFEGEHRMAYQAYGELLALSPDRGVATEALMGKGQAAMASELPDSARAAFEALLKLRPPPEMTFETYRRLGELELAGGGSPRAARELYEMALKAAGTGGVAPDLADEVRVSAALTWVLEGDVKRAERDLKGIVAEKRYHSAAGSRARMELARLAFHRGDIKETEAQVTALLTLDPSSTEANEALELLAVIGDFKDQPGFLMALGRADMLLAQGRVDSSAAIIDSLIRAPNGAAAVEELLWRKYRIELERNRPQAALEAVEKIIAMGGGALKIDLALISAGELCETRLDQAARAAQFYERVLIDFPDSPLVEQARKRLKALEAEL